MGSGMMCGVVHQKNLVSIDTKRQLVFLDCCLPAECVGFKTFHFQCITPDDFSTASRNVAGAQGFSAGNGLGGLIEAAKRVPSHGIEKQVASLPDGFSLTKMGLSYRKSFGAGPFRVSISSSGISGSYGIKGFKVGANRRATWVSLGAGGIRYTSGR